MDTIHRTASAKIIGKGGIKCDCCRCGTLSASKRLANRRARRLMRSVIVSTIDEAWGE